MSEADDALTPAQFLDMASELMAQGFEDEFDVPELWTAIAGLPIEDVKVLHRFAAAHAPRSSLHRDVHRNANDFWRMLVHLLGFHAGSVSGTELMEQAEHHFSYHSQNALVAGFGYRARQLANGDDGYDLRDHVCLKPFEQIDVLEGSTHLCCASWLHKSIGNLATQSHEDVWTSDSAEAIRQSVLDGSYRYCNKVACPDIPRRALTKKSDLAHDPWWQNVIENHVGKIDRAPVRVNLAYDRHCNLSCPSCRETLITSNDQVRDRLDQITQKNVFPLLRNAHEAFVTGSGDPFASRTFRKMLQWVTDETCPDLKIILMTNGMLFTEKEWAKFPNLVGKVKIIKISMDGASKESHEKLRRGSKWDVMMHNVPFAGSLVAKGEIDAMELVFVVQQENFHEMSAFVDLAKRVGATSVYFERITNWGTFSQEEYARKAVFSPTHSEHAAFLTAMTDGRLHDPIVNLNSLTEFLRPVAAVAA